MMWWCLNSVLVIWALIVVAQGGNVSYDGRALIVNGQKQILFSGSIHYTRSTPQMWPSLISKAKEGGIDVIQTYVFWNQHEPQPGKYNFEGRNDLVKFLKDIHAQGLYATLRIGPFIEAEWTYGGLPVWLRDVPGIVYRSDNKPFEYYMQNFTTKIVDMMKAQGLYASQGGPIILSQIENEYKNVEAAFREKGPPYVRWAAQMAVDQQTGVPWVMCKQDDAPDPVINACNGRQCGETFAGPNSPNKPAIWTENWTSFYQTFGQEPLLRSAEDIAFHVALFIAKKKGSYINYYMYHGGTNFGRTGSSYIITGYYDQAPLDEYGLIRQPKWGHLKELHSAIKLVSKILLEGELSNVTLGQQQEAYTFQEKSGACVAFLINSDKTHNATVNFRNEGYNLPRSSISILPDCKNVIFNTAKVSSQFSTRTAVTSQKFDVAPRWLKYKEIPPNFADTKVKENKLLEHIATTKDASDYLWYTTNFDHKPTKDQTVLHVLTLGHVVHAFVNNVYGGSEHGFFGASNVSLQKPILLNNGANNVTLLSVMVGLPDSGAFLESRISGIREVKIQGTNQGARNLSNDEWGYQVGLLGEKLQIYTEDGIGKVPWSSIGSPSPLTWYKTVFDAPPPGDDPVVLNLGSMEKGEAWVNGQSIGRYWSSFRTPKGNPSQTLYHIPRSFLKPSDNLLVLLEEYGGNPLNVSLDIIQTNRICGHVSASHPPPVNTWELIKRSGGEHKSHRQPRIELACPSGMSVSNIVFASYGNPLGNCSNYSVGTCHSLISRTVVEKACLGKTHCSVTQSSRNFGGDPCPKISKSLLVDAQCG